MFPLWPGLVALIVGLGLTVSSLVTGKAMNPFRGFSPFIVSRDGEPLRYWFSVTMNVFFIFLGCAFLMASLSH